MTFDFSKISPKKKEGLPVDPIELFQKLKVKDQTINDLWLAQGDALREWHKARSHEDISVVLNTGAGKTLVGLLIAQSLVNETQGKVLYACSSIQLVEQTFEKATGYGLDAATYFRGSFSNDLFQRCKAPCITTYQALFNGKSKFFRDEISAVVFDDAHAAEHILRDHFSLRIEKSEFNVLYNSALQLFRNYYFSCGLAGSFEDLNDEGSHQLLLVPPFEARRQFGELTRLLNTNGAVSASDKTTFAWEYLKDRIDLCAVLLSPTEITFTPPFIPIGALSYFHKNVRRVFLSATLAAEDGFVRTFGRVPKIIAPHTTAGECERLILFPSAIDSSDNDTEEARQLIKSRKALILVPTYTRAKKWDGVATIPNKDKVTDEVNNFKASKGTPKLLLAARYDGVDLPGDTCRVMIVDDLPTGIGPLERFLWERIGLSTTLRSSVASRIVQSFGRISRGMSDHGVVIITGENLVNWLLIPRNASMLPAFLQKQLLLGYEVSKQVNNFKDFDELIDSCMDRKSEWLESYGNFIESAEPEPSKNDVQLLSTLAQSESNFALKLWEREFADAAKQLAGTLEKAFEASESTGAWHCLWLGYAYELSGDVDSAKEMFRRAHGVQRNIPPVLETEIEKKGSSVPSQVVEVDRQFSVNADATILLPKGVDMSLAALKGGYTVNQTEEAIRALGQYLGFNSSRPDHEHGTGPDVLWMVSDTKALCIEVKTDKKPPNPKYKKEDLGQMGQHLQWVSDNTDSDDIVPLFVGPVVSATDKASPPDDYLVMDLSELCRLASVLVMALRDIANKSIPLTLRSNTFDIFKERKLLWPDCFDTLKKHVLKG